MPNKNILYDIGNSKVRDITSSYYNDDNKLFSEKLVFSSASLNLSTGVLFANNGLLSSSVQSDGQILAWDSANSRWDFLSAQPTDVSTVAIPANSDITGSFLNNATVKSISNVQTGTLSALRGGTGLTSGEYPNDEKVFIVNGSNKLTFLNLDTGSVIGTSNFDKAIILASLTASSATDQSVYNNTITRVKAQFATPPVPPPVGGASVLYSSYDANSANYSGYIATPGPYDGDFTLEAWTYLLNVGSTTYDISRCTILINNNGFALNGTGPTQNGTTGYYGVYTSNSDNYSNLPFIANQWVHLALVKSGNTLKIYANATGSQVFKITNSNLSQTGRCYLGGNDNGMWNPNGYITEMRYVKYAKTPEEIKTYYQSILSGTRGRYTKDENDTRIYSTNNIAISVDNNGTAVTGSGVSPNNDIISGYGLYYYP